MRPLRLRARNFGTFRELDLDVSNLRHVVIVGENGRGKSLLMDSMRCALYGAGRATLSAMAPNGATEVGAGLDFEHHGRVYRVDRTWSGRTKRGATTVDFMERCADGSWAALPKDSIEARLGMSEAASTAITFLRSYGIRGIGEFGAAAPAERKDLLFALRKLDRYQGLATVARRSAATAVAARNAAVDREAQARDDIVTIGRAEAAAKELREVAIPALVDEVARLDAAAKEAHAAVGAASTLVGRIETARRELTGAQSERTSSAARRQTLALRERELVGLVAERAEVEAAATQRDAIETAYRAARADRVAAAQRAAARTVERDAARDDLRVAEAALTAAVRANDRADRKASAESGLVNERAHVTKWTAVVALIEARDTLRKAVAAGERVRGRLADVPCHGEGEFATCPLIADATAAAREAASATDELAALRPKLEAAQIHDEAVLHLVRGHLTAATSAVSRLEGTLAEYADAGVRVDVEPVRGDVDTGRERLAAAERVLTEANVHVATFDETMADLVTKGKAAGEKAARREVVDRAAVDLEAVRADLGKLPNDVQLAIAADAARQTVAALEAEQATSRQRAELVARADEALRAKREEHSAALVRLGQYDAGAGGRAATELRATEARDAVRACNVAEATALQLVDFYTEAPSILLERDLRRIEAVANDWLRQTSPLTVRLDTQAANKTNDRIRETLDVIVSKTGHERPRETFSGSELFRVDLALAIAIGQALGAGESFIFTDEGFAACKGTVIDDVVRALGDLLEHVGALWAIEHTRQVIDVFPARLEVRAGAGGWSEVVVHG